MMDLFATLHFREAIDRNALLQSYSEKQTGIAVTLHPE